MEDKKKAIFREETLEKMSAPEQLDDYLHVTNPGVWIILATVILLLVGVFIWACTGTVETRSHASMIVEKKQAVIVTTDGSELKEGMTVREGGREFQIASVREDEYGRKSGIAEVDLPDGRYEVEVVTEEIRPVEFLLNASE